MWVVLEKPCRVGQRGRGGIEPAQIFLKVKGGGRLGGELACLPKIRRIGRSEGAGVLNTA
jgi:hypothetical protein